MNVNKFYSNAIEREDWVFSELNRLQTKEMTHSYHYYPTRFIPQLAKALLSEYTKEGDLIWDSMCGSGTLNLEAFRNHRNSIGTDINPLASLISSVKTKPIVPIKINPLLNNLLKKIEKGKVQSRKYYISKGVFNGNVSVLKHWFPNRNLRELGHILYTIEKNVKEKKYKQFALCAFSNIIKRSSYWLTSSIKPQIDPDKKPKSSIMYYHSHLMDMLDTNRAFFDENKNNKTKVSILNFNAKHHLPKKYKKVNCIITSPPYNVSYDYSDIFRLSTFFLFYQEKYSDFRRRFIGTPLVKKKRNSINTPFLGTQDINRIPNKRIHKVLSEYYFDMDKYFYNAIKHIKKNGNLIIIVGDTELRGIKIPNAYYLYQIAKQNKWKFDDLFMRDIPNKFLPTYRDPISGRFSNRGKKKRNLIYKKEYILIFRRK